MNIIFFGSFQHYSALILESLITNHQSLITVSGVITTPPMPVGRKQIITKTPVHLLAEKHSLPVFTPEKLDDTSLNQLKSESADFFLTSGYGKILPQSWLTFPKNGSLNLHFSLLPAYRGANPAEWAIMIGEKRTGITLMQMNQKLDGGDIIEQRELPISSTDTRETLYQKLYELGAKELPEMLIRYADRLQNNQFACQTSLAPKPQPVKSSTPYAALLKRPDGFISWETLTKATNGQPLTVADFPEKSPFQTVITHLEKSHSFSQRDYLELINRTPRALATFPSLWTTVKTNKGEKRLKIIQTSLDPNSKTLQLDLVQLEGLSPTFFNQIKNQIL